MAGAVSLGKVAGIHLRVSYSWVLALVLVVATLATSWFPFAQAGAPAATYIGLGVVGALLLFLSVGVHELAHVLFAMYQEAPVTAITLFPFGGVSDLDGEPREAREPGAEFQLAVVGPLANFILAGFASLLQSAFLGQNDLAAALFGYLDAANVIIGLFNLLPAFPLDGGRVLRALIWRGTDNARKANSWSLLAGQVIAYLLMLWGIVQFFVAGTDGAGAALWLIFLGVFLLTAGGSASRRASVEALFAGVRVGDLMRPAPGHVAASAPLQQAVDECLLGQGTSAIPVLKTGRLAGLLTLADARHISRERWAATPVSAAMTPVDRLVVVSPEQSVSEALAQMAERDVKQVPVLRDGVLVGMLGRDALVRYLEQRGVTPAEAERQVAASVRPGA